MTFEEFQNKVQKRNAFDRYYHYALCWACIGLGLFWIYLIIARSAKYNIPTVYAAAAFCLLLGIYGLRLLPNRYKIVVVPDSSSRTAKGRVVSKTLSEFGVIQKESLTNYLFFTIRKKFWHSPFQVHLFYDDERFAFRGMILMVVLLISVAPNEKGGRSSPN